MALEDRIDKSDEIRGTVAAIVLSDSEKYNRKFLGGALDPTEYAEWICRPSQWGGIPELKILSEYYKKILCVVDVGEEKIHKFGGDQNSNEKLFLIYDGTHYNLGVCTRGEETTRIFKSSE